ncbi:MAG: hypothetical protein MZV49_07055 [Rhodopseudomonas palustris]|nr:hypothetical protein [Rhodopseudomonas palustris]
MRFIVAGIPGTIHARLKVRCLGAATAGPCSSRRMAGRTKPRSNQSVVPGDPPLSPQDRARPDSKSCCFLRIP